MTKHEALKDLSAVLRDSPVALPKLEAGPAPLTPAQRYLNTNPAPAQRSGASSFVSQLLPSFGGLASGGSGQSLLDTLLGNRQSQAGGLGLATGLAPVLSGLLGLFGNGGKTAPQQLPLYSAPQRLQLQAGLQSGSVTGADSNQSGMPRTNSAGSQPQVTLHIQAMDTQSILNRSTDIAQAVRQAMLQSHPINDVVADL